MLELPQNILQHLSKPAFEHLMAVEGKVYRKQAKRQTEEVIINEEHYFIKKHFGVTVKEYLKNMSHARMPIVGAKTEWCAIQALNKLGVATTPLVGYGKLGLFPFTQRSFLLTKALLDTQSLEDFCRSWQVSPPPFKLKKELIAEIARIARRLHQNNYYHRDFYLCHFLLQCDHEGIPSNVEHPTLYLIDLHRMRHAKILNKRWQVKDLASLLFSALDVGITQRDVLRFLRIYTDQPLRNLKNDKSLWSLIERKAVDLYKKAHGRMPKQKWLQINPEVFPEKIGEMTSVMKLGVGDLKISECLRVLPQKRWVFRAKLNDEPVLAKVFSDKKAYGREVRSSKLLVEHNILTPDLLHKVKAKGGKYVIVYKYLQDSVPADDLSEDLIKLFAKLHKEGLRQMDCHLDNFLLHEGKIYTVDCASIRKDEKNLHTRKSLSNLALLFAQKPAHLQQQYQALWYLYLQERNWPASKNLDQAFEKLVCDFREYRLRKWTQKIFRSCSAFKCKKRFDKYFCIDRNIANLYSQTLCEYPEAYFHPRADFLKKGRGVTVVRASLDEDDIVIKRYNLKNWKKAARRLVSPSKATRSWRMAHILRAVGIDVPKPLAFFERRLGPFRRQSYFVTAYCPGKRLDRYLQDDVNESELDAIAIALVTILQRLNTAQCYHGDLKASNFIWDGHTMWLLDFDGSVLHRSAARYAIMHKKDWARLYQNWDSVHPITAKLKSMQEQGNG